MSFLQLNRLKRPSIDKWPFQIELVFSKGLYGFEHYTHYLLVGHQEEIPLLRLEPKENRTFHFLVIDPFLVNPDYTPVLSRSDLDDVAVRYEAALILLAIVDTKSNPNTINLASPLLIHWVKRQGKQLLMPCDAEYPYNF